MPETKIKDLGKGGLNVDTPSHQLPPNVFSDGLNLRFTVENKIRGSHTFEESTFLPSTEQEADYDANSIFDQPLCTIAALKIPGQEQTVLVTQRRRDNKVTLSVEDGSKTEIGNSLLSLTVEGEGLEFDPKSKPQVFMFNGVLIMNTGNTIPQYSTASLQANGSFEFSSMIPLDNWETDLGKFDVDHDITASRIIPWDGQLVALVPQSGTGTSETSDDMSEPTSLVISGFAGVAKSGSMEAYRYNVDPNVVGSDDFILEGTPGKIIDGRALRNSFMVYKTNSWIRIDRQASAAGVSYSSQVMTADDGILTSDCVIDFENAYHFVVGNNGIYVHNGAEDRRNISKGIMEDSFYNDLEYPDRTFLHKWSDEKEIWICYADALATSTNIISVYEHLGSDHYYDRLNGCNKAWCYNYETQTWYKRSLPNLMDMVVVTTNGQSRHFAITPHKILEMDYSSFEQDSYLEKHNIDGGDSSVVKKVTNIFPQSNNICKVSVAATGTITSNPVFTGSTIFDPASDYHIPTRKSGRYVHVRIEGEDPQLSAVGLEQMPGGKR